MKYPSLILFVVAIGGCSANGPLGDCAPGESFTWAQGPLQPDVAEQARLILEDNGIDSAVQARNYGTMDSCGTFTEIGLDLNFVFAEVDLNSETDGSDLGENVFQMLDEILYLPLRSAAFRIYSGDTFLINKIAQDKPDPEYLALPVWPRSSTEQLNKKIYLLVYDPILASGEKLTTVKG